MSELANKIQMGEEKLVNQEAADLQQFITFMVADQEYAVDIMTVREIKGWSEITALPNTPEYMRGVINLRGTVVPIIDLRSRFGLSLTQPTKNHVVIIVTINQRVIGLLVDAVSDIITHEISKICPIPNLSDEVQTTILSGLIHIEKRLLGILVLEKIIDQNIVIESHMSQIPQINQPSVLEGE